MTAIAALMLIYEREFSSASNVVLSLHFLIEFTISTFRRLNLFTVYCDSGHCP